MSEKTIDLETAARRVVEAIGDGNEATFEALVHEDLVHHALGAGSTMTGRDAWWARIRELREAFPNLALEVEDVVVDGDRAMVRATMRGTFERPLDGQAPTGRVAEAATFHALRFEDGRVVEWWRLTNVIGWGLALDALPLGPRRLLRVVGRQLRWRLLGGR